MGGVGEVLGMENFEGKTAQAAASATNYGNGMLIARMRRVAYGRVEGVLVLNGQPLWNDYVSKEVKQHMCQGGRTPPVISDLDYKTNKRWENLETAMQSAPNGYLPMIEVKDGLPLRFEIEGLEKEVWNVKKL